MADQRDRISKRQADGELSSYPSWALSASEIGAYAF